MGKVIIHASMSLDGFITGPNDRVGDGMGEGGERLHDWMFKDSTPADKKIMEEWLKITPTFFSEFSKRPHYNNGREVILCRGFRR